MIQIRSSLDVCLSCGEERYLVFFSLTQRNSSCVLLGRVTQVLYFCYVLFGMRTDRGIHLEKHAFSDGTLMASILPLIN